MKQLYRFIAALTLVASVIAAPISAAQSGYVNQSDIDVLDKAISAFTDFVDEVGSDSASIESVDAKALAASTALQQVADHQFSTDLGEQYSTEAVALKSEAQTLKTEVGKVTSVLQVGDEAQITAYFDDLEASATRFENQVDKLNTAVDTSNNATGMGYLWLVIATAILSAAAFVWSFVLKKEEAPEARNLRRLVAYTSLAPFAGALITYITFLFADQLGGSYFIAYGPVLFGGIIFVQAVVRYFQVARPATD
jgi:hypothetical protein